MDVTWSLLLPAQALTYNKMAPMALGRIDIKYRRIACQVPQALDVIVDENRGAGGWIRLQVKVRPTTLIAPDKSMSTAVFRHCIGCIQCSTRRDWSSAEV